MSGSREAEDGCAGPAQAEMALAPAGAPPPAAAPVIALLHGQPVTEAPEDLYIPPEALRVFLESFEGPLDLLLWLIRRQRFDILEVPMLVVTEQYMRYVELVRASNLELAADYLVMAATLMQIKSRLLLPRPPPLAGGEEAPDPQAELARRLIAYERAKRAAEALEAAPRAGRDFWRACLMPEEAAAQALPEVSPEALARAWGEALRRAQLKGSHRVARQELSVREFMSAILRRLGRARYVAFTELFEPGQGAAVAVVNFLAILELAKEGLVRVTQAAPFAPLYVSPCPEDEAADGATNDKTANP
ncbi:MAG: segregation/condensation protein A [Duodenibacillus sp.]|nr:segregation/condensation protein A [Duodenibacillus sp.]